MIETLDFHSPFDYKYQKLACSRHDFQTNPWQMYFIKQYVTRKYVLLNTLIYNILHYISNTQNNLNPRKWNSLKFILSKFDSIFVWWNVWRKINYLFNEDVDKCEIFHSIRSFLLWSQNVMEYLFEWDDIELNGLCFQRTRGHFTMKRNEIACFLLLTKKYSLRNTKSMSKTICVSNCVERIISW